MRRKGEFMHLFQGERNGIKNLRAYAPHNNPNKLHATRS